MDPESKHQPNNRMQSSDSEELDNNSGDDRTSWVYKRGYARKEVVEGGFRIHCLRDNCNKSFRTKDGSTSNIRRHLNKKHNKYEKVKPARASNTGSPRPTIKKQLTINPVIPPNPIIPPNPLIITPIVINPIDSPKKKVDKIKPVINQQLYRIIELCLLNHISFRCASKPSFQNLLGQSPPLLKQSENNANSLVDAMSDEVSAIVRLKEAEIKQLVQSQYSINVTCTIWKSVYTDDFLGVHGHFIDNEWRQRVILLGFESLDTSYDGFTLAHKLTMTLDRYGICDRLFTVTANSSPPMQELIQSLHEVAARRTDMNFYRSHQFIPCLGEIIDLGARAAIISALGFSNSHSTLEQPLVGPVTPIATPLAKICAAIAIAKKSPETVTFLTDLWQTFYLKRPVLIADVVVRWSATYSMIGKILSSVAEFNTVCELFEMSELRLDQQEVQNLREHHLFLKPFFVLTVFLTGTNYPTLNRTFRVYELLLKHLIEHSQPSKPPHIIQAAIQAHTQLDGHFKGIPDKAPYSVSLAMDPRLKYSFWRDTLDDSSKAYLCIGEVDSTWNTHFKQTVKDTSNPGMSGENTGDLFESFFAYNKKKTLDDLERYLAEDLADNDQSQPHPELAYWRQASSRFPQLAPMARRYLSIPATAAPCDHVFSDTQLLIPEHLHRLKTPLIRDCMLLESWLNQKFMD